MIDDDQKYLRLIYRVCQNGYRFKIAITQCTNIVFCAAKSNFEEDQYCRVFFFYLQSKIKNHPAGTSIYGYYKLWKIQD